MVEDLQIIVPLSQIGCCCWRERERETRESWIDDMRDPEHCSDGGNGWTLQTLKCHHPGRPNLVRSCLRKGAKLVDKQKRGKEHAAAAAATWSSTLKPDLVKTRERTATPESPPTTLRPPRKRLRKAAWEEKGFLRCDLCGDLIRMAFDNPSPFPIPWRQRAEIPEQDIPTRRFRRRPQGNSSSLCM